MNNGRNFAACLYLFAQIGDKLILFGRDMESVEVIVLVDVIKRLLIIEAVNQ